MSGQERPQTVGLGETKYAQNTNAADLIVDAILLTDCPHVTSQPSTYKYEVWFCHRLSGISMANLDRRNWTPHSWEFRST